MRQDDPTEDEPPPRATRRAILAGAGVASIAVLGGCARYGTGSGRGSGSGDTSDTRNPGDAGDAGDTGDDPAATSRPPLLTSAVPVGGGVVLDDRNVVVTQPSRGEFKAFTAICTHQGCVVAEVKGGTINCPCHGSKFSAADGSVVQGPAGRALRAVRITVTGATITFG